MRPLYPPPPRLENIRLIVGESIAPSFQRWGNIESFGGRVLLTSRWDFQHIGDTLQLYSTLLYFNNTALQNLAILWLLFC